MRRKLIMVYKDDWERVCRGVRDIEEIKKSLQELVSTTQAPPLITTMVIENPVPVTGTVKRYEGVYIDAANLYKSDQEPLWEPPVETYPNPVIGQPDVELQPIPALITALSGGTLAPGTYFCMQVQDTEVPNPTYDPDDENSGPPTFPRSQFIAITGTTATRITLVHVVAGEFHPVNGGDDVDDWFCAEVFYNTLGQLEEVVPRRIFGKGLVDEDGTGWVYEGTNQPPDKVDPDTPSLTPTHAVPLLFDSNATPDDDGPIYMIHALKKVAKTVTCVDGELFTTFAYVT